MRWTRSPEIDPSSLSPVIARTTSAYATRSTLLNEASLANARLLYRTMASSRTEELGSSSRGTLCERCRDSVRSSPSPIPPQLTFLSRSTSLRRKIRPRLRWRRSHHLLRRSRQRRPLLLRRRRSPRHVANGHSRRRSGLPLLWPNPVPLVAPLGRLAPAHAAQEPRRGDWTVDAGV